MCEHSVNLALAAESKQPELEPAVNSETLNLGHISYWLLFNFTGTHDVSFI